MQLNGHPAPGLKGRMGYFMGARFTIPENPIMQGAGPSICALKAIDRMESIRPTNRPRNALSGTLSRLAGCAVVPVMRTETGQVQAVPESLADTPLWVHIAVGGVISALALNYLGRR